MANPNNPFGFACLQSEGKENRARVYAKDTSAAIYPGDVVKMQSDGTVIVAAAGDAILGVCAAYQAAADTTIKVYDDPNQDFFVQASGDFQTTDVGSNANIVATAGDSTLKQSNHALLSSYLTTSTLQFKVLGLLSRGVNAVGSYAVVRVRPNSHAYKAGVTGV